MGRILAVLFFGVFFAVCAPVQAASPWQNLADPVFVRADSRELPDAAVMSLAQGTSGFLWVGTQGGLARYDGYHFRSFLPNPTNPTALPDGYLRALLPDGTGGLWIGSSSNGLVHFDAASETFSTWHPDRTGTAGPRSASVSALALATDGHIWVGGDGGLGRFDPQAGTFEAFALASRGQQPPVWGILIDGAGTLWAGTQDGLYYRTASAATFRKYPLPAAAHGVAPIVYSLYEDLGHRLWVGSVSTAFVIDPARRRVRGLHSSGHDLATLAPGQQWAITEALPGRMWIGTDAAISVVDAATLHVTRIDPDPQNPGGLNSGRAVGFLHGNAGLIWVANHVGGLLLHNPTSSGLLEVSASRPDIGFDDKGAVAVAAVPGNRLWVGGFSGRLAEFSPQAQRIPAITMPNHTAIQSLLPAHDGTLWVGTTAGLCILHRGEKIPVCPATPRQYTGQSIYALLEDGHRLWVGGSAGLFAQDETTHAIVATAGHGFPANLGNSQVRVLFQDRKKRLWIGTENGLDRLDPNGRFTRFIFSPKDPDSIGPGGMAAMLEDRRGRIWAGANGGPLDVIEEDARGKTHFHRLGVADGMPHENVDGLGEDAHGRIWASTDKGIALIDPDSLRARALGLADGLTDGAFWAGSMSQADNGTLFFGGLDGITVIAPDASSLWDYAPPIVVTALRVGHKSVPTWTVNHGNASIELPADDRDLSVEFSSLDYSAPQLLHYAYKLDGYDRDWLEADIQHRGATYTHLPSGNYTLEMRGTNRLGAWSSHVLLIGIHATPLWYETWWFRLLVGVLAVLIAYAVYEWRTGLLRRRQRELEAVVTKRTSELSDANAKLQELSLSDPLTGLRNRRFLSQHLEADISLTLRRYDDWRAGPSSAEPPQDADILFFLVDLDHFKSVNDRYGHNGGDAVLVQMRDRLRDVFRDSDFIVRWGGDEFLAVARGSRRSEAAAIAQRMCEVVNDRPFTISGDQTMTGTASIGFAAFPFVQSEPAAISWPHVVGLADQALYKSKEAGRNTWFGVTATGATDPAILVQRLENDADDAIAAGHLAMVTRQT